GVLTAAEICSLAAMHGGYHVKKSEIKGMSQRGGSVESYVRFGSRIYSPLPPEEEADIIVCFNAEEYPRLKQELRPGGKDLFCYLEKANLAVGNKKIFLNSYLLGVLSSFLPVKEQDWLDALNEKLKKDKPENKFFFLTGRKEGKRNDL
ncbi:MAG: 2-oxoacid:acceptor oxidoreductase family protein, partial [Candidatus Omnitrophota bacterium]